MSLGPYFRTPVPGPTEKRPLSVSSESKQFLASSQDSYATNKTFVELGVSPELCAVLTEQGIITAFPIQAMTIADALAGRDVCGKAKTGSGKTLGFGLPMLQRISAGVSHHAKAGGPARPRGLVLLPTRELAVQVHEVLEPLGKALGLYVNAVYGGADIERQVKSLRKGCDVIIATPGRLIDLGDRGELNVEDLDVLVLDEADRMADMGFMPQVEWVLRRIAEHPHQTLLFSATLDGAIDRLVKRYLTDPVFHEVQSDTQTVSLMVHHFLNVHQMDRIKVAATICQSFDTRPRFTVIFDRVNAKRRWPISRRTDWRYSSPPTSPLAGSTLTGWTASCTSIRPKITRPTCTDRDELLAPVPLASLSHCSSGIRSLKPK
jgi:superfamily II DNA/RNA helicase